MPESAPIRDDQPPDLPARGLGTHKGDVGRVAIVAGSRGMSGAAVLSALGALRGGAGLVRVACPRSIQPIIAAAEPCCMTVGLDEDADGHISPLAGEKSASLAALLGWASVIAAGPGLGVTDGTKSLLSVLMPFAGPLVLDADALNLLASGDDEWWAARPAGTATILTPHPGEMARLRSSLGLAPAEVADDDVARVAAAHEFARRTGCIVVLKGRATVVASASHAYVNATGNPGMATGGMGDVLTGLIAALIGQGLAAFDAARLGVHVHGAAADHLAAHIGPVGILARDLAEAAPAALAKHIARPRVGFR